MDPNALRAALVAHFDQKITPEVAAAIFEAACATPDNSHKPEKFGETGHDGYEIHVEPMAACLDELHPLHMSHWLETEKHRHGLVMDPDYEAMLADERAGRMVQFVARKHGRIAAHLRMYLGTSRHTRTTFAQEDTLYLHPQHRPAPYLMTSLMRFAEGAMRAVGAIEIRADSKLVNNAGALMRRLRYEPYATSFVKFFEDRTHVQ